MTQAAQNLVMDLEDTGCKVRYLIRDRDGKYPALFDAVLADAGIEVVLSRVRRPRMNSIMELWIQACRHELLDRTLTWSQAYLFARSARVRTTPTGLTGASPTPGQSRCCPNRSSTPIDSLT